MITIDGSMGEGGGQVVRSSVALSAITGTPVRITNIRAGRKKPGLMRQHLTSVLAASEVCGGKVTGAELGSREVSFYPGSVRAGEYEFSIGTAGSTGLVFQTVLPILLQAGEPSRVTLKGGTHNSSAPPFDFLVECFFPALRKIGHKVEAKLIRHGFYPAGGGEVVIDITPAEETSELVLMDRGAEVSRTISAILSNLRRDIAERELEVAGEALNIPKADREIAFCESNGPGNVVYGRLVFEHLTSLHAQFGERGVTAEQVGKRLADSMQAFLAADVAVDEHLADQLLLPMALAKGGQFSTSNPSLHSTTNAEAIGMFLGRVPQFSGDEDGRFVCTVEGR